MSSSTERQTVVGNSYLLLEELEVLGTTDQLQLCQEPATPQRKAWVVAL